jgi:glycosyltransferase involved in cell wall biosynthesis
MSRDKPIQVLSILGQKPEKTGSGILVRELWQCALNYGDRQRLIVAGYVDDDYRDLFGNNYELVTYSFKGKTGQLPFPVLGMSDAMPYPSMRFADASSTQIELHIDAFRSTMEELILKFKPDVIHIHHLWVLIALSNYCGSIPCFVTIHGTGLKQLKTAPQFRNYVEGGLKKICHFFSVSKDIMYDACNVYNLSQNKVSFIGNGYNEKIFRLDGRVAECKDKLILAAGKFVDWKGYRFLIRACGRLKIPHQLVIAGSGPEKNRQELIDEAIKNNMQEKMVLAGHIPQLELAKWMRRADVFVLPSVYEPFGLVFLEAMACGSPVIASDCGGAKDVIREAGLISLDLATLIPPLKEGGQVDEDRYVADFHSALEKHLCRSVSHLDRVRISDSAKGLEWSNIYRLTRTEYLKAISTRDH